MKKVVCFSMLVCLTMQMHGMNLFTKVVEGVVVGVGTEATMSMVKLAGNTASQALESYRLGQTSKRTPESVRKDAPHTQGADVDPEALYRAVVSRDISRIKDLLKHKQLIDGLTLNGRFTPLMAACKAGNLAIVRLLCDAGARVNKKNISGESALVFAARADQLNVVVELVDKRHADVTIQYDGRGLDVMPTAPAVKYYLRKKIEKKTGYAAQGPMRAYQEKRSARRG